MMSQCTAHDLICDKKKKCKKDVVGIVKFDLIDLLPTNPSLLILQRHTGVCEEKFDVNSKIAQIRQNM